MGSSRGRRTPGWALLWIGGHLPLGGCGTVLAAAPLLAWSHQFCRMDARTEDHFFLGFASYWNVVALDVVDLDCPPTVTAVIAVVCAGPLFSRPMTSTVRAPTPSGTRTSAWRHSGSADDAVIAVSQVPHCLAEPRPHGAASVGRHR